MRWEWSVSGAPAWSSLVPVQCTGVHLPYTHPAFCPDHLPLTSTRSREQCGPHSYFLHVPLRAASFYFLQHTNSSFSLSLIGAFVLWSNWGYLEIPQLTWVDHICCLNDYRPPYKKTKRFMCIIWMLVKRGQSEQMEKKKGSKIFHILQWQCISNIPI